MTVTRIEQGDDGSVFVECKFSRSSPDAIRLNPDPATIVFDGCTFKPWGAPDAETLQRWAES